MLKTFIIEKDSIQVKIEMLRSLKHKKDTPTNL